MSNVEAGQYYLNDGKRGIVLRIDHVKPDGRMRISDKWRDGDDEFESFECYEPPDYVDNFLLCDENGNLLQEAEEWRYFSNNAYPKIIARVTADPRNAEIRAVNDSAWIASGLKWSAREYSESSAFTEISEATAYKKLGLPDVDMTRVIENDSMIKRDGNAMPPHPRSFDKRARAKAVKSLTQNLLSERRNNLVPTLTFLHDQFSPVSGKLKIINIEVK